MSDREYDVIDEILEDAAQSAAEDIADDGIPDIGPTVMQQEEPEEQAPEAPEGPQDIPVEGPEDESPRTEKPADDIGPGAKPEEKPEKRGLFRKKPDKRDEQIAELNDRLKRQLAEFENFRNRTDREKAAMYEIGARGVIEKLLPVLDNFERGMAAVPEEGKDSFMTGMEMVYGQLVKTLTDLGVEEIAAKDAPFDPAFHNAVMHVDDEELGENVVCEVFQKGYTYHGIVIRPAMVKVAN